VQNLPPEYRVAEIQPAAVSATFTGPKRSFYFFDPNRSRLRIDIDLSSVDASGRRTVRISEQNVRHPPNITLQQLNPATVRVTVRKLQQEPPVE
jgi:YbbR domain-containing protein